MTGSVIRATVGERLPRMKLASFSMNDVRKRLQNLLA